MATASLELVNVSKAFGGLRVTRNVSFSVAASGITALIGPNGAGKTTIFNLVSGVYSVDSGQILLQGKDVTAVPSHLRIRHGVTRNFQNIRLMQHLTVTENLMLGQHIKTNGWKDLFRPFRLFPNYKWQREAREALAEAGLMEYASATVTALPYGIRKRVDLVRALMSGPKLLMLDEPAAGLNPSESNDLMEELSRISKAGVALLIVEHDMNFVRNLCQQIIVLNFGEKIAEGSMAEIQKNAAVREAYLGTGEGDGHAT